MQLNSIIRKLHTYTGLQASIALFFFSISIISASIENKTEPFISHQKLQGSTDLENIELAKIIHSQVGLKFEITPEWWMISEEEAGNLLIKYLSPSARREVRLNKHNGDIEISAWPLSASQLFNHLHKESIGRRRASDSLWLWLWSIYIEVSIFSLFVLPATGLYMWISSKASRSRWAKPSLLASSLAMGALWHLIR